MQITNNIQRSPELSVSFFFPFFSGNFFTNYKGKNLVEIVYILVQQHRYTAMRHQKVFVKKLWQILDVFSCQYCGCCALSGLS